MSDMEVISNGQREASIRHDPGISEEFPWNVGLYDWDINPADHGYIESVGAVDRAEAWGIANRWIHAEGEV